MGGSDPTDRFVVIGAGPAGLTAAYELVRHGHAPVVLEQGARVGGLARTENHRGFRFDLGGHRFFTKVPPVFALWQEVLGADFLRRPRLSRIYYKGKFFDYPLTPLNALGGLGVWPTVRVLASWVRWRALPYRDEHTFEQWVTNRFGRYLFRTFFETYTEKVWGVPCSELRAEWAAQRIKDLSLGRAALGLLVRPRRTVRTLIEEFHYPRLGPGMMWDAVRDAVVRGGGTVETGCEVIAVRHAGGRVVGVEVAREGGRETVSGTHFVSSMPVTDLIVRLDPSAPPDVRRAAGRLRYRDFLTVCLVVDRPHLFPDNWIYVHDPGVRVSRIQNFKNWSPDMVPDPAQTSLGLEYFCTAGDDLWRTSDAALVALGAQEVERVGLAPAAAVVDGWVSRVPKAYPIYDGAYAEHLQVVREFVDGLENLQTIGRGGLHRYDNQDHAMVTGILAVRNAVLGERHDLWAVNTEPEYHEEDARPAAPAPTDEPEPSPGSWLESAAARALAVLLGIALTWDRQPAFFSEPRFWAEEGRVFFARAWRLPWWEALFAAPLDYLSLYTNLAVVLAARLVPLEEAPLVTTLAAFVAQTAPLVILAVAAAPEWRGGRRYVGMAIVLFASLTDEVWLTTLHSHYYFALVAFLVLLEPADIGRARAVTYAALVGFAGLTGPVACFLAPLFVLKARRSRRAADVWQATALGLATLVQVGVALAALAAHQQELGGLLARSRSGRRPPPGVGLAVLPFVAWVKAIVLPILGMNAADGLIDVLAQVTQRRYTSPESLVFAVAALIGLAEALAWLTRGLPSRLRWPLAGSWVLITSLSVVLAFGDKRMLLAGSTAASRYTYVPGVVLLVLLLHVVPRASGGPRSLRPLVAAVLLTLGLAGGAARYPATVRWSSSWPRWSDEVRAWRQDPGHTLAIWPPGWKVRSPRPDELRTPPAGGGAGVTPPP
jgi:protoporphyrinogen oxidase